MSMRPIEFVTEEYFHIYNRGNSKQTIFKNSEDYFRFQVLLYILNNTNSINVRNVLRDADNPFAVKRKDQLVSIHSYCLMPNHYHLVLSSRQELGISKFMQKVGTAYSMYFNTKYNRTGSLFEGKFKAKHADSDEYLKYLFSYIHLNPSALHEKEVKSSSDEYHFLTTYPYSSLSDYIKTERAENAIIDTTMYGNYLPSIDHIQTELYDWINFEYVV